MGENFAFQNLSSFILSPDSNDHDQQSGFSTNWKINWKHVTPDAINTIVSLKEHNSQLIQYPRFIIDKEQYQSPASFHTSIQLINLIPNEAVYHFHITPNVHCKCEVLVPSARQCIQKFILTNNGYEVVSVALEWFIFLKGKAHQSFSPWKKNRNTGFYLNIDDLHILSSLIGPTKIGQHSIPYLTQRAQIEPGETSYFFIISNITLTQEDCENQLLSFNLNNWDGIFAQKELSFYSSRFKIECEKDEWNAIFAYSQIQAERLLYSLISTVNHGFYSESQPETKENSLTSTHQSAGKQSESGFSIFSLNYSWHVYGDTYANQFEELLNLVFKHQQIDGQIYWSIPEPISSLKGNAIPILASLVWRVYDSTHDIEWLEKIYPKLRKFLLSWFSEFNDKDQDGCPEWRNAHQLGYSETLLFQKHPVLLHPYFFRQFEHPGLLSLLIEDFHSLAKIAKEINSAEEQYLWQERANILSQHLDRFWDKETSAYQVMDYFTHQNPQPVQLLDGNGEIHSEETFEMEQNNRIRIDLVLDGAFTRPVQIKLKGKSGSLTIKESINFTDMIWVENKITAISQYTYTSLENVSITGIKEEESWQMSGMHFTHHDISMLLPLIEKESNIASINAYKNHLKQYGFSLLVEQSNEVQISSNPWNAMILEPLLKNNDIASVTDIISRVLNSAAIQFTQKNGLYEYYDSNSACGYGDVNHIHGLFPQALFLNILGIKKISQDKIYITHFNPFSIPFTVQYKGMKLKLFSNAVEIQFRGFVTRITQTGYHRIRISTNVVKQI